MSSAGTDPAFPRRSVFISYASEDRAAARALRDALTAAGLDVWYDESELGGGDAWDQKIRRQIRECDYFMPVISANSNRRKEGYFRREWRLATERTLDMADDVLFLLPVTIDETIEPTARVPEKFLTVQWLRLPGGKPGPALDVLVERLRAGEHEPPPSARATRAPFQRPLNPMTAAHNAPPPPVAACAPAAKTDTPLPPMPSFPPVPEKTGFYHGVKFMADVFGWAATGTWLLFRRLPKWGRVLVVVWLVMTLFSARCSRTPDRIAHPGGERPPARSPAEKKARQLADRISQSAREGGISLGSAELSRLGNELAQVLTDVVGGNEKAGSGKPLLIVPFAPPNAEDPPSKFAHAVFLSLYGRLSLERRAEVGVTTPAPEAAAGAPDVLLARAVQLGANFILSASPVIDDASPALKVQLVAVPGGSVQWSESYPATGADPTVIAQKIGDAVLPLVPKKGPRRGK